MLKGGVLTNSQSRPKSDGARNFAQGGIMNFPDVLRTVCGTRLPMPQSAFGIDLTLPLPRPYTSLGPQHRCPSGFGPPPPPTKLSENIILNVLVKMDDTLRSSAY